VLSGDGWTLRLYGINRTGKRLAVKTQLVGFARGVKQGTAHILRDSQAGPTPEVLNTRDEPDRVRVFKEERRLRGDAFNLTFEAYSVTLYELELERGNPVEPAKEK